VENTNRLLERGCNLLTVVGIYAEQQEKMRRVGKAMTSFVDLLPPLGIFSAGFSMIPILIV
jgi:hypothetical protein